MKTTPITPRRSLFKTYQPAPVNSSNSLSQIREGFSTKHLFRIADVFSKKRYAPIFHLWIVCFWASSLIDPLSAQPCIPCVPNMVHNSNTSPWSNECYLAQTCLPQGNPCQANDVTLTGVFIADSLGNPVSACSIGSHVTALLWGNFSNNTGTNRYAVRTNTQVWINGMCDTELNSCSFDLLPAGSTAQALVGTFDYICGQTIELRRTWIAWSSAAISRAMRVVTRTRRLANPRSR